MTPVISKDGTAIAFDRIGAGAPVILVDGALCYRASGPGGPLAAALADRFTVFTYDRRGRGESGNTAPYAVEREIEDIAALIKEAGGAACVCGVSSGAALALEAASRIRGVTKLALYEAPCIVDDSRSPIPDDIVSQFDALIAAGRRGDAVKLFMKLVGVPAVFILLMRVMPAWPKLRAVAHTLPYDMRIMKGLQSGRPLPAARWTAVTAPTLVLDGGKSPVWMRNATRALAGVLPTATYRTLAGQTHMVNAKVLGPVLAEFFGAT